MEADVTAMTAFQVAGRVARVYVDEGQIVQQGQVLAELDPSDYRNAFEAARGQADAAAASDSKAQAGLRPQELEQARIDYTRAADEYKRMKFLMDRQSLAANDFQKFEAQYLAAKQRYEMAQAGTRGEEKLSASAGARAAAAQLHEAQKHLDDCKLRAPISGVIGMKHVDVGNTIAAGTPVFTVLQLNPVQLRAGVPEAQIGMVRTGARAQVTVPALQNRVFEGKLESVGVAADATSRTYAVKISIANADHALKAGMVGESRIFGDQLIHALTVPGASILRDSRGVPQVWVYDPQQRRVFARRVDVGALIGDEVEITRGLNATDQVVVAGQQNVREGSLVQVGGGTR